MIAENTIPQIVAEVVPGNLRLRTLPRRFPNLYLVFESLVYTHMDNFAEGYRDSGGYWEFYELSNGGFYMSLKSDRIFNVEISSNYFKGQLSADAASIVANLFALCHMANAHEQEYLTELYYELKDYAGLHPESMQILSAID